MMQFKNSVHPNKGRYEITSPWTEDHLPLLTHDNLAMKQFQATSQTRTVFYLR